MIYNDSIDPRKELYAKETSLNEFDIDFFK